MQNLLKWILSIFQDGTPLVTHSQILSTFQDGGQVKFPTLGIIVDVKILTHMWFTKSNSPGLPDPPPLPPPTPVLGLTIDRCMILYYNTGNIIVFSYDLLLQFRKNTIANGTAI